MRPDKACIRPLKDFLVFRVLVAVHATWRAASQKRRIKLIFGLQPPAFGLQPPAFLAFRAAGIARQRIIGICAMQYFYCIAPIAMLYPTHKMWPAPMPPQFEARIAPGG
jgi:hypothetical protein